MKTVYKLAEHLTCRTLHRNLFPKMGIRVLLRILLFGLVSCEELKLVIVLMRHTDRTPDSATLYPLDPYLNETYYPIGLGQLTIKGKQRAFAFGHLLRKRYDSFFGPYYLPELLEAYSTDMDRTKATLQLVLAGVFPPKNSDLEWNMFLNWQPIPYNYTDFKLDMWLSYSYDNCPKYAQLYDQYMSSQQGVDFINNNLQLLEYINKHTNVDSTGPVKIWGIYTCLLAQEEWGLKLPDWTKAVYPEVLKAILVKIMRLHVATKELKQLCGGFLLKKIIGNMLAKAKNEHGADNKRLILYSGHDVNILYMSAVLEQAIDQVIPYGAYYMFELVKSEGVDCVKIYRNNYTTHKITAVKIPGCNLLCPLKDFIRLLNQYIPSNDKACWV